MATAYGDRINKRDTEALKTGSKNERACHASGWQKDNDWWFVKKIDPKKLKAVAAMIEKKHMRGFVVENKSKVVLGEAADCLKIDKLLR